MTATVVTFPTSMPEINRKSSRQSGPARLRLASVDGENDSLSEVWLGLAEKLATVSAARPCFASAYVHTPGSRWR